MAQAMAELTLNPIGHFYGDRKTKSAIPRQGILSQQTGFIQFAKGFDAKSAMMGLEKMSHVWVIFHFHEVHGKPKVLVHPPRSPDILVGVWATRSPYRPNSLGLTLAKIEKIEGLRLYLSKIDLLDQTPILDIKPYVTESDRPSKPRLGWIDEIQKWKYGFSKSAKSKYEWLFENGLTELRDVMESQFGTPPLQPKRKRVKKIGDEYMLAYRTWRFHFRILTGKTKSLIVNIQSGYSENELKAHEDPFQDKDLHRKFKAHFKD
jgi:tRNA-Thr(GGU) m(6)t(6)A37 methyltransferase TsaA